MISEDIWLFFLSFKLVFSMDDQLEVSNILSKLSYKNGIGTYLINIFLLICTYILYL